MKAQQILILGASYGSLLGVKLALAGHDVKLAGSAVTVSCAPGDNLMMHRALYLAPGRLVADADHYCQRRTIGQLVPQRRHPRRGPGRGCRHRTPQSGHIPQRGERIEHPDGYELEVLAADPRRVKRVRVRRVEVVEKRLEAGVRVVHASPDSENPVALADAKYEADAQRLLAVTPAE